MAIVLPHGVLFRGGAEEAIRKTLINKNYLDAVIGLPANLFFGVSIPTIILVFKKNKQTKDILFIEASKEFSKGKNQNTLTAENIDKIMDTYKERQDIERYAHVAGVDEVKKNEYNLNIPRYVDTFEEEQPVDVDKLVADISATDKKISSLQDEINAIMEELTASDPVAQQQLSKIKRMLR